jgi:hypothetical protein
MTAPRIRPLADRPPVFLSVMIPTHNPDPAHLCAALTSVTEQIGGADFQIEVVDDASADFDAQRFLAEAGLRGVGAHRNPQRLGLAGNWNACIERARGRWVHILHQDDFVLPGFYAAMRSGIERSSGIGAAFCDTYFVDHNERRRTRSTIRARRAGILEDWQQHVFVQLAIQSAAIVVRREAYEAIGGFDDDFDYVLDWDLWKRLAVRYPLWYEPRPLACYRMHRTSQTARLRRTGQNIAEIAASIARSESLLAPDVRAEVSLRARRAYSVFAVENAITSIVDDRDGAAALAQLSEARRMSSAVDVARAMGWIALRSVLAPARDALFGPRNHIHERASTNHRRHGERARDASLEGVLDAERAPDATRPAQP